jgi:hypothetical protein
MENCSIYGIVWCVLLVKKATLGEMILISVLYGEKRYSSIVMEEQE